MLLSRANARAAAWLTGLSHHARLDDTCFITATKLLLSLSLIPEAEHGPLICTKDKKNNLVHSNGLHAIVCAGQTKGRANHLHDNIKKSISSHLRNCLVGTDYSVTTGEFHLAQASELSPVGGHTTDSRGDFAVFKNDELMYVVDVKTVNPSAPSFPHAFEKAGSAATKKYDNTIKQYTAKWNNIQNKIVPFVIELGGRIHDDSFTWLRNLTAQGFQSTKLNENGVIIKVTDQAAVSKSMRLLLEQIQTKLQRSNAYAVLTLAFHAKSMQPLNTPLAESSTPSDAEADAEPELDD